MFFFSRRLLEEINGQLISIPRSHQRKRKIAQLLKNTGKPYINPKGEARLGKEMRAICTERCRLKCYQNCPEDQRLNLFREYYALANVESQWQFLANHIDTSVPKCRRRYQIPKKNRKAHTEPLVIRNRTNNVRYFLNINNERLRVCKDTFLATYDIGSHTIKTVVQKTNDQGVLVSGDCRGVHTRLASNAKNTLKVTCITGPQ